MTTTIQLDDELLAQTKQLALQTNRTLTAIIEEALRQHLGQQQQLMDRKPVHLKTVGGQGLLPGVDLDDSAALLELMETNVKSAKFPKDLWR